MCYVPLVFWLLFVMPAPVAPPPKLEALVHAFRRNDAVEIDRIAHRLGAGRLEAALEESKAEILRAALRAAPSIEAPWTLLKPICQLISHPNEAISQAALRAGREVALTLDRGNPETDEVPSDAVAQAQRILLDIAVSDELPVQRREAALGIAVLLSQHVPLPIDPVAEMLESPVPRIRRAAVDALAPIPAAVPLLAEQLLREEDPMVATSEAAAICPTLPRVLERPWARVRELALERHALPADALDLLQCLAAGSQEDQIRVAQAATRHPVPRIRAAAQRWVRSMVETPTKTP